MSSAADRDLWLPLRPKRRTPLFACPCWGKPRHVSFAEPISILKSNSDSFSQEEISTIPKEIAEEDDELLFHESYQTELDAEASSRFSSHRDTMTLGLWMGPDKQQSTFKSQQTTKKQIVEEIIRFFLFVVLFQWKKEDQPRKIQQQHDARDSVTNTTL